MELAQQFFSGLDGPASLTFLGLLATAFLIGLLPPGLMYLARLRRAERRITRLGDALERVTGERDGFSADLAGVRAEAADLDQRLRSSVNARAALQSDLARLREEAAASGAKVMAAEAEAREREASLAALQGRNATLTAQVQSLKSSARQARAGAIPSVFDADVMASLSRERARGDALEERITRLTADNEELRAQLTGAGQRPVDGGGAAREAPAGSKRAARGRKPAEAPAQD